jgi:hypothetical protein
MAILILAAIIVAPSRVHFGEEIEIFSVIWSLRIEGALAELHPTLGLLHFENNLLRFLFVLIAFRCYTSQTSLKRGLLFGVLIEVFMFVSYNGGNILYTLFPLPGYIPSPPTDFPIPIYLIIFLLLFLVKPRSNRKLEQPATNWLDYSE